MSVRSVVHLIPYDGVGGVEEAARSMKGAPIEGVDLAIRYIFTDVRSRAERGRTFNAWQLLRTARSLAKHAPDVLVASLWRSVAVGILVKLLRPNVRLVLFLHNAQDAHVMDWVVTRLGAKWCSAIWADSEATLRERLSTLPPVKTKVLSFVLRTPEPSGELDEAARPAPVFLFWGRFSEQKNLQRTLRFFQKLSVELPQASLHLIGATSAELPVWRERLESMLLTQSVRISPTLGFDLIREAARNASFYLQTSRYEGMAMSVVEAMQLGLVPVVTPVGEIARYCRNGENAMLLPVHEKDEAAESECVARLVALLADDGSEWRRMRRMARSQWEHAVPYSRSFAEGLQELVS